MVAVARDADPRLLLPPPHDTQLVSQLRRLLPRRAHLQVQIRDTGGRGGGGGGLRMVQSHVLQQISN